jgi:RNA polymerase sigma-70 factor (ECF subfamily)
MIHEHDLYQRLLARDEDAFTSFVDHHHYALLRLARSLLHDHAAEELVQEAWLTFIHTLPSFQARSSLKTWLFGILINLARQHRRSAWREIPTADDTMALSLQEHLGGFDDTGHWNQRPAAWPLHHTPESSLARQQLLNTIQDAIELLPHHQRAVLILRDLEDLPSHEVASMLGLQHSHTRVLLHRARLQLRALIKRTLTQQEPT